MIELNTIYGDGFSKYFITHDAKLISHRNNRILELKTYQDKKGYVYCKIWDNKNNICKHISIHRTVAMAFISNPDNKPEVNHKDKIKNNNNSYNLEWVTRIENVRHAENGLRNNKICEVWYDNQFIGRFNSKSQACRFASDKFGVGKTSLQKYFKSGKCVIIEGVTTSQE